MVTVYKAVRRFVAADQTTTLVSAFATGELAVTYTPGEEMFPPLAKSALFAFDTVKNGRHFAWSKGMQLWEAEAPDSQPCPPTVSRGYDLASTAMIVTWWRRFRGLETADRRPDELTSHRGSVFCPSLTLTKQVVS